jgi:XTP/dITP diphosphohydrolase
VSLYFVTKNKFKGVEVTEYLRSEGVAVEVIERDIQEILDVDVEAIVRHKVLAAFKELGRPCAVEHGALMIDELKGLPGGLSKPVWDTVGERICSLIEKGASRGATARSVVGYCDGNRIHMFVGNTRGSLAECGRGAYSFQWDPVFIPDGATKTFGELGFPGKAAYSQAKAAWSKLAAHIKKGIGAP